MPTAEPGWATTEFWVSIVSALAILVRPFGLAITPELQGALVAMIAAVYTLARSARKQGTSK